MAIKAAQNTPFIRPDVQKAEDKMIEDRLNSKKPQSNSEAFAGMIQGKFEDWIKIFTTSLKHQDPSNPMDPADMITQFSQIANVSGLQDLGKKMERIVDATNTTQTLEAAKQIDHIVDLDANVFHNNPDEPVELSYFLPQGVGRATVTLIDEQKRAIRSIDSTVLEGKNRVQWDGKTQEGQLAPQGNYSFRVDAFDKDGNRLSDSMSGRVLEVKTAVRGRVTGASRLNGQPMMILGGENGIQVPIDALVKIQSMYNPMDRVREYGQPTATATEVDAGEERAGMQNIENDSRA